MAGAWNHKQPAMVAAPTPAGKKMQGRGQPLHTDGFMSYFVAQKGRWIMAANAVVRARVNEKIKEDAGIVLASMGLTVSDAFRMLLVRIATEKALPFDPLIPNEETIEAMKAARRGELTTVGKPENLLASLNA